ncbi:MAG TPA: type II toxin-antitoxin system VapC family toxin [Candidatus Binataceae bacterium]|nr:type II toxin-antitoxin system VapC family toxin [Candidatus Binataceae bacterium]
MRFLLDTCVISDFAQGHPQVLARVKSIAPAELAASTITEMEVAYGLILNPKLARRLKPVMDAFFGAIHVLPYDRASAQASASARAILKRRGRPIGAYDVLIAGAALAHDLIVVTSNVREFKQVEGLRVEDWRS